MNIAIDVRPLQSTRTGVGEYAYELLSAVFSLFPEHTYFLCSSGMTAFALPVEWQKPNIVPLHLKVPNKVLNFAILISNYPRLSQWPKLLDKNIIFDAIFYPNLSSIATEPKVPMILTVHDITFTLFPQFLSWQRWLWHLAIRPKTIIKKATHITTPSFITAHDVAREFKIVPEKITPIRPGVCSRSIKTTAEEIVHVKNKLNLPNNFLLFLGTIEPRKNISNVIRAFGEWQKQSPNDAELIIAGAQGWKNFGIFELIKNTPKVRYVGYVSELEKNVLYQLARVFVYPSFYEGFGLPILEAFIHGVPVLTSNRSALTEVAGSAAYFVDPRRQSEIVLGMKRLWDDTAARAEYNEAGKKQASEFSWEKSAKEFMKIINPH